MRGLIVLLGCVALTGTALAQGSPPEASPGQGPRGTSGEARNDAVGYARVTRFEDGQGPTVGIAATHANLPQGSFVEVTALDSGKTVAMMVIGPLAGRGVVGLSPQAADALGIVDGAPVRVRAVTPSPWEQATLRAGRASGARLDAPQALLVALRGELADKNAPRPGMPARIVGPTRAPVPMGKAAKPVVEAKPVVAKPPVLPEPAMSKPARPAQAPVGTRGGYGVQIAALSSADRAAALAKSVGGHVVPAGKLFRVQLGPYGDAASANRARDGAVRQGYRDAHIFHSE